MKCSKCNKWVLKIRRKEAYFYCEKEGKVLQFSRVPVKVLNKLYEKIPAPVWCKEVKNETKSFTNSKKNISKKSNTR